MDPQARLRMGEAGRQRAEREYSVERYLRDVEQLYLDVLGSTLMRRDPASTPAPWGVVRSPASRPALKDPGDYRRHALPAMARNEA